MIPLGALVKDMISGYEGVVTSRLVRLFGPPKVALTATGDNGLDPQTGFPREEMWFEEARCAVIKERTAHSPVTALDGEEPSDGFLSNF